MASACGKRIVPTPQLNTFFNFTYFLESRHESAAIFAPGVS
jgi:hypothetical protein